MKLKTKIKLCRWARRAMPWLPMSWFRPRLDVHLLEPREMSARLDALGPPPEWLLDMMENEPRIILTGVHRRDDE